MKTTSNGFKIPDAANSSSADKLADVINAFINNSNICNQLFNYIIPHFAGGGIAVKNDQFTVINDSNTKIFGFSIDKYKNVGLDIGTAKKANSSYIDFYTSGRTVDYDSRIIAGGGGSSTGKGYLNIECGSIGLNGRFSPTNAYFVTGNNVNSLTLAYNVPATATHNYMQIASTDGHGNWGVDMWRSDVKLKENIEDSNVEALETVLKLKHRQFDWKANGAHSKLGYIAQELQEVNPDFVFGVKQEDGSDILQPRKDTLIPFLSKAIQELNDKVEDISIKNEQELVSFYGRDKLVNKECKINIDTKFLEESNTEDYEYDVYLTKYGQGDIFVDFDNMKKDSFIVKGSEDIKFGYQIVARKSKNVGE